MFVGSPDAVHGELTGLTNGARVAPPSSMVIGTLGPILALLVLAGIVIVALIVRLARGEGLPPVRRKRDDEPRRAGGRRG